MSMRIVGMIVDECEREGIDLCKKEKDWYNCYSSLTKLGKRGFHFLARLIRIGGSRTEEDGWIMFCWAMERERKHRNITGLEWFYSVAYNAGVDVSAIIKEASL